MFSTTGEIRTAPKSHLLDVVQFFDNSSPGTSAVLVQVARSASRPVSPRKTIRHYLLQIRPCQFTSMYSTQTVRRHLLQEDTDIDGFLGPLLGPGPFSHCEACEAGQGSCQVQISQEVGCKRLRKKKQVLSQIELSYR